MISEGGEGIEKLYVEQFGKGREVYFFGKKSQIHTRPFKPRRGE